MSKQSRPSLSSGEILRQTSTARARSRSASPLLAHGAGLVGQLDQGVDQPGRTVRILAAILAHAGRVVGDLAGNAGRVLAEPGREQEDLMVALQAASAASTVLRPRSKSTAPDRTGQEPISASNQEIASPLLVDQPRVAVLVPHAVEAKAELFGALAVRSRPGVALAVCGEVGEVDQRVVEKEAEPDALARAAVAEIARARRSSRRCRSGAGHAGRCGQG